VNRALAIALISLVTTHASAAPQADAPAPAANAKEPIVPVNDALARIEDLKKRVSLEPLALRSFCTQSAPRETCLVFLQSLVS
jgi:hypothetical protein